MAQFDVFRTGHGDIVIDCQADQWSAYNTRFVGLLLPEDPKVPRVERLNPLLDIDGEPYVMMTEFAAALPTRQLSRKILSFAEYDVRIKSALDMLIHGH